MIENLAEPLKQARRQDTAGGTKNQKGGEHFKNTVLDVCSNQVAKREMGGHRFQMWGPGTTGLPAGDGSALKGVWVKTQNPHNL